MSAFNGPQGKGAMLRHRAQLRQEAEARNAATSHERTRAHRLDRCGCESSGGRLLREVFGGVA